MLLTLSLAACGSSDIDLALPQETKKGNTLVTYATFLDGMWQNAAGETIVVDAALGAKRHCQ